MWFELSQGKEVMYDLEGPINQAVFPGHQVIATECKLIASLINQAVFLGHQVIATEDILIAF